MATPNTMAIGQKSKMTVHIVCDTPERGLADPVRERAGEVVAQVPVRMMLQIGVHRARHRLPLPWAEHDLTPRRPRG